MRFDPSEVDDVDFELLPEGTYRLAVVDGELKTTRAGTGKYVAIALQVVTGPHKDRRIFDNFNVENPNPKAAQIGRAEFKRFLAALGITTAVDLGPAFFARLSGKTVEAKVVQELGNDNVNRNKVDKYLGPQGQAKAPAGATPRARHEERSAQSDLLDQIPF